MKLILTNDIGVNQDLLQSLLLQCSVECGFPPLPKTSQGIPAVFMCHSRGLNSLAKSLQSYTGYLASIQPNSYNIPLAHI